MQKPHKRLIAWEKTMDLVVLTYRFTKSFPESENMGLASQMRRAAVSAPSNIAEGAADRTPKEFMRYLSITIGTLNELDTQFEIARRVGYLGNEKTNVATSLVDECLALTYGLRRSLKKKLD